MSKITSHPHHYANNKNMIQVLLDYAIPAGLLIIFFIFYNNSQLSSSEMIKTTGLLAIALLGLTLIIGPLSRIIPSLGFLKAHRKVWGILSFAFALIHVILVTHNFYHWDLSRFVAFGNPRYPGVASGLVGLGILALVTMTSNNKAIALFSPNTWKIIQTTSYIAMAAALYHFYFVSLEEGNLVFRNMISQTLFWFSAVVLLARIVIFFLPSKK